MKPVLTWKCWKCQKKNAYADARDSAPRMLMEMKVMHDSRPKTKKKVMVKCDHCSEKQTIEVDDN